MNIKIEAYNLGLQDGLNGWRRGRPGGLDNPDWEAIESAYEKGWETGERKRIKEGIIRSEKERKLLAKSLRESTRGIPI